LRIARGSETSVTIDQALGAKLRAAGSDGVVYPRASAGRRVSASACSIQTAPGTQSKAGLDYHWDSQRVDLYRELKTDGPHKVFLIIAE
jgi:hypothetical protein